MNHLFKESVSHIPLPEKFTYPFLYTPHPLCVLAAEEVKDYIANRMEWKEELTIGKMFGVLIVKDERYVADERSVTVEQIEQNAKSKIGYLAAFSGNLAGKNLHSFFVPPVYDLLQPEGFFKIEEEHISGLNTRVHELENEPLYHDLQEKQKVETERIYAAIIQAKAELKAAKKERELRRQSSPTLSKEEETVLIRESQYQKAEFKRLEQEYKRQLEEIKTDVRNFESKIEKLKTERKKRSSDLQQRLFQQFRMLNAKGEVKDLSTIFEQTAQKVPPAGAGECALPKLLQYAYLHGLKPLAMAEFWWGDSPKTEIRYHGYYYPSCKGKCEPILHHMLQGLIVDENPLLANTHQDTTLEIVYEDEWLLVVNKPAGMLSVPGKAEEADSVYRRVRAKYPKATGPMIVHRLDMATSGLLLVAKTKKVHQHIQAQFKNRTIKKRYLALLEENMRFGEPKKSIENEVSAESKKLIGNEMIESNDSFIGETGRIELPLCPNPQDRPRQMVSEEYGKPAVTEYRILKISGKHIRIAFYPLTGRTHQLRIHASHPQGLGCPIIGDDLYGKAADRLYLHAEYIEFRHPIYGDTISVQKDAEF